MDVKVASFIKDARNKLVDSGTRNRLVHVNRKSRGKFLNVINERSDDIFRILYTEKKKMKFRATETALESGDDDEVHFEEVDLTAFTDVEDIDKTSFTDRNLDVKLDTDALQKRLLQMARDSRTAEEEQGINILFLALGFLAWFEDDNSQIQREAPLVLIPVELIRNERTSTYDVRARDEDILTNLSLQARLQDDFGLTLPELEIDDNWNPGEYFVKLSEAVSSKLRWKIDENGIQLGFFSFAKQLMLRDLEQAEWPEGRLCNDPLIQNLLVEGFEPPSPLFRDNEFLDDRLSPENIIQVVDADAPQTKVIEEVRDGRHLVVQGPPGTGKSQTITNIIAAAAHEGKTVLFMAEKMAALDVVLSRLQKCQLGDLCLELHSRHANKKEVLQEISHTLQSSVKTMAPILSTKRLKAERDKLNDIVKLLHSKVPDTTFTVFEAMADVVSFIGKGCRPPRMDRNGLEKLNKEKQKEIEEVIKIVAKVYSSRKSRVEHPFVGVQNVNMDPVDQERMWDELRNSIEIVNQVLEIGADFSQELSSCQDGIDSGQVIPRTFKSLADLEQCAAFLEILNKRPPDVPSLRGYLFGKTEAKSIIEALLTGVEWSTAKQEASSIFHNHAWSVSAKPLVANLLRGTHGGLGSFFARLGREYRHACTTLAGVTDSPLPKSPLDRLGLAKQLLEVENRRHALAQEEEFLKTHLASVWRGEKTDFPALHDAARWVSQMEETGIPRSAKELEGAESLAPRLIEFGSKIIDKAEAASKAIQELLEHLDYKLDEAGLDPDVNRIRLDELRDKFEMLLREGGPGYVEWSELQSAISKLANLGISRLIALLDEKSLDPLSAIDEFNYACAEARWNYAKGVLPKLGDIASLNRHDLVQSFIALDKQHCDEVQKSIKSHHLEKLPKGAAGEMGIIRGEIGKKRPRLPIRRLISSAGNMIQRIKPVFLMSPISIAQFLPPKSLRFDLLVIDEASQVRPEDAIGAIARCNQIVVVGDQKQLPPTSFFDRLESDIQPEEDDEVSVARVTEMESILTLCEARGIDQRMLEWHYRSRDPSLIRVSNDRFYDNQLILPPSPEGSKETYGMFFTKVPGVYASGGSGEGRPRTNKIEAEYIAKEIAKHACDYPSLSLGIVTFSKSQADMVTEILERDRRVDAVLNDFLREGHSEDCFVKNIENVQGDERDVIFVSVGYGPTVAGGILTSMNFGPINKEGGERRLNVLFTRARFRCRVFSSFDPGDIEPNRVKWPGPKILQQYMQFAQTGRLSNIEATGGMADSPFEEDVANVIRSLGFLADHQVGDSGFRIDLGIRHPDKPGRYILAVECDGATYHSALSARERDRHRQAVLELMGWKFHRIWSTDWFHRREQEIDRLKSAMTTAQKRSGQVIDSGANKNGRNLEERNGGNKTLDIGIQDQQVSAPLQISVPKYVEAKVYARNLLDPHETPIPQLAELAKTVVDQEGPLHFDVVARRIAEAFGKNRTGTRIQKAASRALNHARSSTETELQEQGGFWFTRAQKENPPIRNRNGITGLTIRAEMLPPIEISAAAQLIKDESGHVEREELIREISQLLGFKRTGSDLKRLIGNVLGQDRKTR